MNENRHTVRIQILGAEYPIEADADPAYIQKIAAYVDSRLREIPDGGASQSLARMAILTALNIADDLHKERQEKEFMLAKLEERIDQLVRRLDQAF